MMAYNEVLNALCGTLADESVGGVNFTSPIDPEQISAVALLLRDGRVALLRGWEP